MQPDKYGLEEENELNLVSKKVQLFPDTESTGNIRKAASNPDGENIRTWKERPGPVKAIESNSKEEQFILEEGMGST